MFATGASAQPGNQSVSQNEIEAFLKATSPRANTDWDVSRVRDSCWAIITYRNIGVPEHALREVSLTHDFSSQVGELRVYTKDEGNRYLRELASGRAEFALYFGRPLAGTWHDNVPLDVIANHTSDTYIFSTPVAVGGILERFAQLPGFSIYTSDRKKQLFNGYSEGNVTGAPMMRKCLTDGGWTPAAATK